MNWSPADLAALMTSGATLGGGWLAYRKWKAAVAQAKAERLARAENEEGRFRAAFDKRMESYMDSLEERIRVLHVDMGSLEQKLRETREELDRTRAEATTARVEAADLRCQLDAVRADRDRLELRVRELEKHANE